MFQEAEAMTSGPVGADQSLNHASNDNVVNAQVGVQVGNVCVQALAADSENC
jgi:hypothetical protein